MSHVPLYFQFREERSALMAVETMTELGYHAHSWSVGGKSGVRLLLHRDDLTSALEIAQAHGGVLLEEGEVGGQAACTGVDDSATAHPGDDNAVDSGHPGVDGLYRSVYALDSVPIPAHLVREDERPEAGGFAQAADEPALAAGAEEEAFDPSGDDYDHFEPGVRL